MVAGSGGGGGCECIKATAASHHHGLFGFQAVWAQLPTSKLAVGHAVAASAERVQLARRRDAVEGDAAEGELVVSGASIKSTPPHPGPQFPSSCPAAPADLVQIQI